MARRKNGTLDEQITNKEAEITKLEELLKEAKKDLKGLIELKELEEINELKDLIKATGKSIQEIKNQILGE